MPAKGNGIELAEIINGLDTEYARAALMPPTSTSRPRQQTAPKLTKMARTFYAARRASTDPFWWPRGTVPLLAQTLWATESIGSALLGLVDEAGDAAVGDDPYDGHGDIAGQGYHHAGAAQCQCGDDADQVQEGRGLALDVGAQCPP